MTKFKSQGLYIIRIKHRNDSGSAPPLIPTLWDIGILHHKQAKLHKDMQHSLCINKSKPIEQKFNFIFILGTYII